MNEMYLAVLEDADEARLMAVCAAAITLETAIDQAMPEMKERLGDHLTEDMLKGMSIVLQTWKIMLEAALVMDTDENMDASLETFKTLRGL